MNDTPGINRYGIAARCASSVDRAAVVWLVMLCTLGGCSAGMPAFLRRTAPPIAPPSSSSGDPLAAQCAQIRADIRDNEQNRRRAPATSTSPEIVAAAQAKADQRIEDLRARYADLECPSHDNAPSEPIKVAPVAPAPGG